METNILRDSKNNIVGIVRKVNANLTLVYDKNNKQVGKFQSGNTYDKKNNYFSRGDQSQRLIK